MDNAYARGTSSIRSRSKQDCATRLLSASGCEVVVDLLSVMVVLMDRAQRIGAGECASLSSMAEAL